jgi:hypothetical protein
MQPSNAADLLGAVERSVHHADIGPHQGECILGLTFGMRSYRYGPSEGAQKIMAREYDAAMDAITSGLYVRLLFLSIQSMFHPSTDDIYFQLQSWHR